MQKKNERAMYGRFETLLASMLGVPASQSQPSDTEALNAEHDEGYSDTQTPTDTSEDAS